MAVRTCSREVICKRTSKHLNAVELQQPVVLTIAASMKAKLRLSRSALPASSAGRREAATSLCLSAPALDRLKRA